MNPLNLSIAPYIVGAMALLILAEIVWSVRSRRHVYEAKETGANFAILIGFQLSKLLLTGYQLFLFRFAGELAVWEMEKSATVFLFTFFATDFFYYLYHRAAHEIKFFWAFHIVHHSGMKMNLTTSYRLNWFAGLVGVFFYLPLAVLGFPPEFVGASIALNLVYQFFLHTEVIGTLGALEGVVNTPSAHRVHHGSNEIYLDKNYGGVLMVWDRLFGTYQPETETPRYGITTGAAGNNPFRLVLQGFYDLAAGRLTSKG